MKKLVKKVATSALAATLVLPAGLAGAAPKFPDVNPNTVTPDVQQAIEALAEQGIIKGFPDGTFGPNKSITRAQFAKILAQIKGLEPNPAAAAQFTDVKDPEQQGWVGALVAAGLTTGTTPTTYSPNRPIQRDQAATFLVRALELEEVAKELDLTPTTTDGARINASHKANVGLLEKVGLIKGYPDGSFGPGDPFKRQQAANLLYKVQQDGDTYVSAAQALLNKVEVVYNDNGTVTVKGSIKGAVTVDVVVKDTEGNVLYEQKGVSAEDGAFEVTTNYVGQKDVVVTVTAYDAEGNVVSTLEQQAKAPAEGEVKGYTDAPDLIRAYSDGKYVYFVFDEPINKVLDEDAFYVITFGGTVVPAKDVRLESDKTTVRADFYNPGVPATATVAYVEEGAVNDDDRNQSIDGVVPLNNVNLTAGTTGGPDLVSVKIDSFKLEDGNTQDSFKVEYRFDEKINDVTGDAYDFVLVLKDGTMIYGSDIANEKSDAVEVEFEVVRNGYTLTSGDGTANFESELSSRYAGKTIDRDDVALAVVLPGAVEDDHTNYPSGQRPNPLTITKARTSISANYLRSVDVDLKNAEITYKFDRNLEDISEFDRNTVEQTVYQYFGVYTIGGSSLTIGDIGHIKKVTVDNKSVTVELDKKEPSVAKDLASVVGAFVLPVVDTLDQSDEAKRVIGGTAPISRSYSAGDNFAPILEDFEASYDEDDEILTLILTFSHDIIDGSVEEDEIVFYNAEGEKVDANVKVDDVNDEEVVLEIEIDEDDYEEIVAFALKPGFAQSDNDGHKEIPTAPAVMPF